MTGIPASARPLVEGTELEALTALREVLSAALLDAAPDKQAAISRELRAVLADLRRLGAGREESTVDQLAARRARRRSAGPAQAEDSRGAAEGGHGGA